jgi:tRNA dimethylallyltransferase
MYVRPLELRGNFTDEVSAPARQCKHHNRGMQKGFVLGIFGPTASGKTAVAEQLARRFPAELISADSMQLYRGLPILTNQPTTPTRLVGICDLDHESSVAEYQELAHKAIDDAIGDRKTPVVVGGTGLYLRAALSALELPPAPLPGEREHWQRVYDGVGGERAHELLAERDPAAAASVHPNDRRRVVRALELASIGRSLKAPADGLWSAETRHPTVIVGLDVPRNELLRRIEERTRTMFEAGVEDEVARALAGPISATARKALGLEQVAVLGREEAVQALNIRTRRYAAYQRKWMRRIPGLVSVAADRPPGEVADEILEVVRTRQRLPARRGRAADG